MKKYAYYKVILLHIDTYETTIQDERHYPTMIEAKTFANSVKRDNVVPVIVGVQL